uniref:NADPH oxidase activator 1 n=1 Tax=Amphilophus citrinellus TaxID=61819 RepID=A0A3Q0QUW2_AMPCI
MSSMGWQLLRLWDESVQAVDAKDWQRALDKLKEISDPTSRTLFNTASVYLALGQLELALKALDLTIAKDERLAVAFFQRGSVMMEIGRLEEALSDYIWAQKHIRENVVIDYKQLGLRFKLYSWQVLYNAAAVYCRMGQWEQARDVLLSATQERGPGRGINIEEALESIRRKQSLVPLLVPEGVVFRPRKQDIEQLQQRDFLGKAKVCMCTPGPQKRRPDTPTQARPTHPTQWFARDSRDPPSTRGDPLGAGTAPGPGPQTPAPEPHREDQPTDRGPAPAPPSIPAHTPGPHTDIPRRSPQDSSLRRLPATQAPGVLIRPPTKHMRSRAHKDPLANRTILYQMVALYDYTAQGPEDLEFSEGDTIDILGEVNQEWLEGHCAGNIGIFPSCFYSSARYYPKLLSNASIGI